MTPADPLTAYLQAKGQRNLVLDGGFGTELARHGKDLGSDDLWSARILADDPASIVRVHADYLRAGAVLVLHAKQTRPRRAQQGAVDGRQRCGHHQQLPGLF